jgi:Rieske Fe-S protein
VLTGALALAFASSVASGSARAERSPKPQAGDRLAFMVGERKDQEIKPADLEIGKEPTLAYPMDPATGKVLTSRVGLLVVVRLKPEDLQPSSQPNAAEGIVAFSALCTHYGCPVTTLHPSQSQIVCNCHGSVFNAADKGAVTAGPATRRLSMLPLAIKEGALVVAGNLDGPVGPPT